MSAHQRRFLLILACVIAACNGPDREKEIEHQQSPADTPTVQNSPHTGTPAVTVPTDSGGTGAGRTLTPLPQEKKDSIGIEGTNQPITLKLIHPPNADPPFMTYMPKDFVFDPVSSGEGTGYYFYTAFAGKRNPDAYLLLYVFPANTSREDAIARVKDFVSSRGTAKPAEYEAFTFRKDGVQYAGGIDLRQHGNRYYYIARNYPVEMADGFGPRAAKITDNWKWLI